MARAATSTRRARGSLSQDEILDGAQHLVERRGLAELSMPALARHLKSGVTSIYWYFRSKEELLQALSVRVSRDVYQELPPIGDGPWDEELFGFFVAFRDLVDRTPIYRELLGHRDRFLFEHANLRPALLRRLDDGLAFLVAGGLSLEQAADAINACATYTRGFVVLGQGRDGDREPPATGSDVVVVDPDAYPLLSEVGLDRVTEVNRERFELGLRLVIDGVRCRVAAGPLGAGPAATARRPATSSRKRAPSGTSTSG